MRSELLPELASVRSDIYCGCAGSQGLGLSLRVGWVGEGGHRLGDVVVAGYCLQTADRLEESAGSRHPPGSTALSPGQTDSLLSSRETGQAEVSWSHQGEVRHLQRLKQPLWQP